MSLDNKTFDYRIYQVAKDTDLEKTVVSRVLHTYLQVCTEELCKGRVLRIVGLLTIRPNVVTDGIISTTAMLCKDISKIEGLPYFTVHRVVRAYLNECKTDILKGNSVVFLRLARLSPVIREGKIVDISASTSHVAKEQIFKKNEHIIFVRAGVCKVFKSELNALCKA